MTNLSTRIFALGAVCGMRTMLGPAMTVPSSSPGVKLLFGLLAVGEFFGDKLPNTPARIAPGGLFGRLISGAGVGYAVCRREGHSPWPGIVWGTLGALAGAYGGYYARQALDKALHVPDAVVAVGEDVLAMSIGRRFAS